MTAIDYAIVALYFALIVGVGVSFSGSQKSLKEYFLGGQNVPWWAAAFSGIATLVSAVSYLSAPGVAAAGNYTLHQYRLGLPLAILLLCWVMLPFFHRQQRYSIYEYFEERFDLKTRLFASGLFVVLKVCYIGLATYAPALVIEKMFGWSTWPVVIFVGVTTTLYTVLGGLKAVIWTDTLQLFVLMGGLVAVAFVLIGRIDGGLGEVVAVGTAHDKFRFLDFSFDLTTRYTFWGGLVGGAFFLLTQYGVDQAELQRFMATRSLREGNIALVATLLATFAFGLFVFFIGTMLFVFYTQHPDKGGLAVTSNEIFPKFIIEELPAGLKGLLVAGVLSAAMSTVSAVLNSVTTVGVADFYNRFVAAPASVRLARGVTLALGLVGTALAGFAGSLGNILELGMSLSSFFGGPLVGIFLLGMLNRRAGADAAFAGLLIGLGTAIWLGTATRVSFLWYGVFASAATFGAGWALSFLFPRRAAA
jgi:SSS family solute:Na+ symporter